MIALLYSLTNPHQSRPKSAEKGRVLFRPVAAEREGARQREQHFKVFKEFRGTTYAERYGILCRRLVLEHLYDAACLVMSSRETGPSGDYKEPNPQLSFRTITGGLG